ncbi:MAG: ATP-binding protein [Candidatus Cryptobacteroides sp.]
MNIDGLLNKYFSQKEITPRIEVFDKDSIFSVYSDIVKLLNSYSDIELSVLQAFSYCFYEVLDNVLTHSEKMCGTVITRFLPDNKLIQGLVSDDGIGIQKSLSINPLYNQITEHAALSSCIQDKVTDGKGMGFGLYSTARLIKNAGIRLVIHSGKSCMQFDGNKVEVYDTEFWQGTIIYFEIHSDKEIDPNDVVENRTDCAEQFNESFIDTEELDNLW